MEWIQRYSWVRQWWRSGESVEGIRPESIGLSLAMQILVFCAAVAAILSRRPGALLNAQFYAEDGAVWYSDAYHFGWLSPLLAPHTGYFQSLPRLVAAIATLVAVPSAPLVMNIAGIIVQALPVTILLSSRLTTWAPFEIRAAMAVTYLALPNTAELDATITEGQWHLALLACMVVLANRPQGMKWRMFDWCVLLLSGFSGPFCLILLPIAFFIYARRPERWRLITLGILGATSIAQSLALFETAAVTRSPMGLGASSALFAKILAGHVYLGALIGKNGLAARNGPVFVLLIVVAVIGTAVVVYCALNAGLELRLFILFSAATFAASLKNPMVSVVLPQWEVLKTIRGAHYWFFPMLAFVWCLLWCAKFSRWRPMQRAAIFAIAVMCIGIVRDWRYPRYLDFHFSDYAHELAVAREGALVVVPINPIGWSVRLAKKGPNCQTPPFGTLDKPADENTPVSDVLPVSGWVTGANNIEQLSVFIDHSPMKSVVPNVFRPDIDRLYPESSSKERGWQTLLDISKSGLGQHKLTVWALDGHGCDAEIGDVSVERVR